MMQLYHSDSVPSLVELSIPPSSYLCCCDAGQRLQHDAARQNSCIAWAVQAVGSISCFMGAVWAADHFSFV